MDEAGKRLAIAGASSGIGAEVARAAWASGWSLALGSRRTELLEELAAGLGAEPVVEGQQVVAHRLDVTDWDDQQAFVAACQETMGGIDAGFANAGFGAPRGFLESTPEHWRDMVLTNVYGCALTIRAMLPAIQESRGHMVLTGSVAGRRVLPGSLYSATKWSVTAMAEALRQEVGDSGVRVTLIGPGMVDTPFFDDGTPEWALEPGDVASAVMYALEQPARVDVNEILLRPTLQVV